MATNKTMEKREMSIAVSGLTGAGKSTILNGLVGQEVFKEGHHLTHETITVAPFSWSDEDNNFTLTVYDTPGFEDCSDDADRYREEIKKQCSNVDLLLYCISVQETRPMLKRDGKTLKELKNVFSQSVWEHCIIVFTYANTVALRSEIKLSSKRNAKNLIAEDYHANIQLWTTDVKSVLQDVGIPNHDKIPIISAGSSHCCSILDDGRYWLTDLYCTAVDVSHKEPGLVLILANAHRIKHKGNLQAKDFNVDITQQPIVVTETQKNSNLHLRLQEAAAGLGSGTVTGVVGATIGATVGALAIGIPSFGIAAGLGLVLGGAIGGGTGVGLGISVYKMVKKFKNRKD